MNKTANYQLNQWVKSDRVLMDDFNADNAKLDAAIKAVDTKADGKAAQSALDAAKATIPKVAAGVCTGNGEESQKISLGFTPKAVFLCRQDGFFREPNAFFGGVAVTGAGVLIGTVNGDVYRVVEITDGGFLIYSWNAGNDKCYLNQSGFRSLYFAFG